MSLTFSNSGWLKTTAYSESVITVAYRNIPPRETVTTILKIVCNIIQCLSLLCVAIEV